MSSVNTNGRSQQIGKYVLARAYSRYFNGYMGWDFHMIDGQALDASYFGETKEGIWIPKKYEDNGTTSCMVLTDITSHLKALAHQPLLKVLLHKQTLEMISQAMVITLTYTILQQEI